MRETYRSSVDTHHKWSVMRGFVFFDVRLTQLLNKQSRYGWFETPWRLCDVTIMVYRCLFICTHIIYNSYRTEMEMKFWRIFVSSCIKVVRLTHWCADIDEDEWHVRFSEHPNYVTKMTKLISASCIRNIDDKRHVHSTKRNVHFFKPTITIT